MRVVENLDLKEYNSFKIHAFCKRAYFPKSVEDLSEIYSDKSSTIDKIIIGEGNNIIFSKKKYENDFVIFNDTFNEIKKITPTTLNCGSGLSLKKLSEYALEHSLTGLEIFYDIPSSLGGAVVMNAGAYGIDIKDFIKSVKCFDINTNTVVSYSVEELNYTYRTSIFQKNQNLIVVEVTLELEKGDPTEIKNKMLATKENRWNKQPRNYPNAGSVFKRPKGYYVGEIIENLNLKGFKIGGAQVSEKHGGFIINVDKATGKDIVNLINYIQDKVYKKHGFKLEIEQRII